MNEGHNKRKEEEIKAALQKAEEIIASFTPPATAGYREGYRDALKWVLREK